MRRSRVGKLRWWAGRIAVSLLGLCLLFYILFPFAWSLVSSFQTNEQLFQYPPQLRPTSPWFTNYYSVFTGEKYGEGRQSDLSLTLIPQFVLWIPRAMMNSLIVGLSTIFLTTALGAPAAYALSRFRFRLRGAALGGMLVVRALPTVAILIPLFILMRALGFVDKLHGLILVLTAFELPFAVWILREYFSSIPTELDDAARIDGCTPLGVLARIVLPLSAPGVVVASIIVFMTSWSAFLIPLILTKTPEAMPLQVVAGLLVGERDNYTDYGLINAVAVLSVLPPILIALVFQRYIITGIFKGAIR